MNLFEIFPLGLQIFWRLGEEWSVDEILVHIVQLQFLEREFECFLAVLRFGAGDLSSYIEFLPRNTGLLDRRTKLGLISVDCIDC
jgi:hypothetical protein